jgi:hypothetical protein
MIRTSAYAQTVLEGVPLPAQKPDLVAYARNQGAEEHVLEALRLLPDREYESLDEVGEAIAPVQPLRAGGARPPRPESGDLPGGQAYTA